jgi:N-acyl-D-amino-acid deacylase
MHELVIYNANIADPKERTIRPGSLGVSGGKIAEISSAPLEGSVTIDAKGLTLSPGFIDVHAHMDREFSDDLIRCARLSLIQGVTTLVSGNCGGGVPDHSAFFKNMDTVGFPVNQAAMVGGSALRRFVNLDGNYQAANNDQLDAMLALADRGFQAGACGVSFGIAYVPGTGRNEVVELAKLAKSYDGIVAVDTHMDDPHDLKGLEFVIDVARETGARAQISHFVYQYGEGIIEKAIQTVYDARDEGVDVWIDSGVYVHWTSGIGAEFFREENLAKLPGIYDLLVMATGEYTGERLNYERYKFMRENLSGRGGVIVLTGTKESIPLALLPPFSMPSSDTTAYLPGQGHPQIAGSMAGFFRLMRESRLLTLPETIYRATLLPATVFRLEDKGRMEVGADADLVVFDPKKIEDKSDFFMYGAPDAPAVGVKDVVIGGKIAVKDGEVTGFNAGRAVRAKRTR